MTRRIQRLVTSLASVVTTSLIVFACAETATIPPYDGGGGASGADGSTTTNGDDGSSSTGADGSVDGGSTLVDGSGDATPDGPTFCTDCQADFCGCGACTRDQIVCTKNPTPCPLGCASSCDTSTVKCGCVADRCVSLSPPPEKVPCYSTLDCPPANCCKKNASERRGVCVLGAGVDCK